VIRVGVFGASGKMGRTVCEAVASDPDLELAAAVNRVPGFVCGVEIADDPKAMVDAGVEVAVDFTQPDVVKGNVRFCCEHAIHCVVGTTGLSSDDLDEISGWTGEASVFVAPNFSIGAVLMMHFARQAAKYYPSCEVVELHHTEKLDAPSGTALRTAQLVQDAWDEHGRPPGGEPAPGERETAVGARGAEVGGVRVHGLRLKGRIAHQEVLFGAAGEAFTIRHDTLDRSSFMPGVLLAVKAVASRPGLTVGLEQLLDL